jgi:hypothetical protein
MKPENNLRAAMDRRLSALHGTDQHVRHVLRVAKGEQPVKAKKRISAALIFAIIALVGVAVAATLSPTIEWIQKDYGQEAGDVLKKGNLVELGRVKELGPLTYEWVDTIASDDFVEVNDQGMLYGTVVIRAKLGENVILIGEDYPVTEPAGYNTHMGEKAPDGAKSYAELAEEKGARIILGKALPRGLIIDGKEVSTGEVGYTYMVSQDNVLTYRFMLPTPPAGEKEYTISMWISNWEVRPDGQWLRGEADEQGYGTENTWQRLNWHVTVPTGR